MKTAFTTIIFSSCFSCFAWAASTAAFSIGALRDASGTTLADDTSTWAVIVSNSTALLPGGLTDGTSLTGSNSVLISDAFDGISLTTGDKGLYTIITLGAISSADLLGEDANGVALGLVTFDLTGVATAGKLWGLYWFPGKDLGDSLSGSYQVGGFAQSTENEASGGTYGTLVPADGSNETAVNFIEGGFNQNILEGSDTGLAPARFTAVAIPEPTTLTLTALAALGLLRRRRA